jgi:putative component of toxin-antitoxin plasmid stabilization module
MIDIVHYLTPIGDDPFQSWLDELEDLKARVAVLRRIDRVSAGNFGATSSCVMEPGSFAWTSGRGIACISDNRVRLSCCCCVAERNEHRAPTSIEQRGTWQTFGGDSIDSEGQTADFQKPRRCHGGQSPPGPAICRRISQWRAG